MNYKTLNYLLLLILFLQPTFGESQIWNRKKKTENPAGPKKDKDAPKTIKEFLGKDANSDDGLLDVHLKKDKYYWTITDEVLSKDMLLVSRIAKIPSNLSPYLNAGSKVGEQLVSFEKNKDKILLRTRSYQNIADENDPINISVESNNFQPIIASFEIKAYNDDSTAYLVEVTSLFENDIKALSGLNASVRKNFKVKNFDKSRSLIESMKSFPINVEIQHVTTYNAGSPPSQRKTETLSLLMNQSLILLPEEKMQPRLHDERVGWFTFSQIDYSSDELKSDRKRYIRRWKLIPKDIEAYNRGELVEPIKPIVYYLDPATPIKWRKYFIQGIEDWNACFETAGFKNAIKAKPAPTPEEDPDFSPEDARYSVVRYVASTTRNAVGPSVSDPRTGEIIESDIIWYHNHLRSYRNRYLLETGAANPKARTLDTPEEEIGEMMRRVISHEIGHALGLPHNMKASAAYPVDSLRSGKFTQEFGIATTIMDYARYNYVAQPGDENIRFVRQIGPYDHYSIDYGYRYIDGASTEEEKRVLDAMINSKEGDPVYLFGGGYPRFDPTSLTENIGDDNVKASEYGIKNLKIVGENLISWTMKPASNYDDLEELYGEFLGVWNRYIGHVVPVIGGIYETLKSTSQDGEVYTFVRIEDQKRALDFLKKNVLSEQNWLKPQGLNPLISYKDQQERIHNIQVRQLMNLLQSDRLNRMDYERSPFTSKELFNEVSDHLFQSIAPDETTRVLQRAYVDKLIEMIYGENKRAWSDHTAIARLELRKIQEKISTRISGDSTSSIHYYDLHERIIEARTKAN